MSTDPAESETPSKASGKKPLLIGLVLAILGAGGGFFAVNAGILSSQPETAAAPEAQVAVPAEAFSFVALDPLIISLPGANGRDHLRFVAQLEVDPSHATDVEAVKPRIVDVLNGYLRAVDLADLEDPAALMRFRSQMLRRIQVVTGPAKVKDLLIMEFVLS